MHYPSWLQKHWSTKSIVYSNKKKHLCKFWYRLRLPSMEERFRAWFSLPIHQVARYQTFGCAPQQAQSGYFTGRSEQRHHVEEHMFPRPQKMDYCPTAPANGYINDQISHRYHMFLYTLEMELLQGIQGLVQQGRHPMGIANHESRFSEEYSGHFYKVASKKINIWGNLWKGRVWSLHQINCCLEKAVDNVEWWLEIFSITTPHLVWTAFPTVSPHGLKDVQSTICLWECLFLLGCFNN